jgi:uncharacterized membrane protein
MKSAVPEYGQVSARRVSVAAISIAIVTVMVTIVRIPVPATGGYWHLGVVAETFVGAAFGPLLGLIAAGAGAAIADLIAGYGSFAPLTLAAHGSTGLLMGWLGWKKGWAGMLAGWVLGGLAQVALYFLGEATLYGFGAAGAAAELPGNLVQVALGGLGLVLFQQVRRVYPRILTLASAEAFEEA